MPRLDVASASENFQNEGGQPHFYHPTQLPLDRSHPHPNICRFQGTRQPGAQQNRPCTSTPSVCNMSPGRRARRKVLRPMPSRVWRSARFENLVCLFNISDIRMHTPGAAITLASLKARMWPQHHLHERTHTCAAMHSDSLQRAHFWGIHTTLARFVLQLPSP